MKTTMKGLATFGAAVASGRSVGAAAPTKSRSATSTRWATIPGSSPRSAAPRPRPRLAVPASSQDVQFNADLTITTFDTMVGDGVKGIAIVVPDKALGPVVAREGQGSEHSAHRGRRRHLLPGRHARSPMSA